MNQKLRSCLAPIGLTLGLLATAVPSTSYAIPFQGSFHLDQVNVLFPPGSFVDRSRNPGDPPSVDIIPLDSTPIYSGSLDVTITPGTPAPLSALRTPPLASTAAIPPLPPFFITSFGGFVGNFDFINFSIPTGNRDSTGNFIHVPDTDNKLTLNMTDLHGDLGVSTFPLLIPHLFFGPGIDNSDLIGTTIDVAYNGTSPLLSLLTIPVGTLAGNFEMEIVDIDDSSMQIEITDTPVGWVGVERMFYFLDTFGNPSNRGHVDGFIFVVPEPSTPALAALGLMGAMLFRRRKTG